jgi:predicted phosphoribosyltransferase
MGKVIADALGGELDVVLVHKLGAPGNPEFAVGSVDERGKVVVAEHARELGIPKSFLDQEADRQWVRLLERRRTYTPQRPPVDPKDRVVLLVDDGVATGSTLLAALELVREAKPRKLVAVVGVAPEETVAKLGRLADEVVCLATPSPFYAVGRFYADFREVSDDEVVATLTAQPAEVAEPVAV